MKKLLPVTLLLGFFALNTHADIVCNGGIRDGKMQKVLQNVSKEN